MTTSAVLRKAPAALLCLAIAACEAERQPDGAPPPSVEEGNVLGTTDRAIAGSRSAAMTGCSLTEDFEGLPDGSPWPAQWVASGGVVVADVRDGWGRIQPDVSGYSLGRMFAAIDCQDVDASVTFMFIGFSSSGAGMYGRHNGAFLTLDDPPGAGYGVFAETFRNPMGIGAWQELGGHEAEMTDVAAFPLVPSTPYRMRLRITQADPTSTLVQVKVWNANDPQPAAWNVEYVDDEVSLQESGGGIALDAFSSLIPPSGEARDVYFDDLVVTQASGPPPEVLSL